jgi:hypothetical protein
MQNIHDFSGRLGNEMFRDAYIYAQYRDGIIPDIYLQDEKYFKKYESEIKERFGTGIGFLPYIGVHVRRGDYVNNPFYVDLCSTDYYDRAMALFPNKQFLIFSDDTAYCREQFKGDRITVVEGGTELSDFNKLASCEHQIIANSSYSWWAAYLNPNPNKKVIAPLAWHPDGIERTKIPQEWTKV